jgi:hypothetical protein
MAKSAVTRQAGAVSNVTRRSDSVTGAGSSANPLGGLPSTAGSSNKLGSLSSGDNVAGGAADGATAGSRAGRQGKVDTAMTVAGVGFVAGSLLYLDDKVAKENEKVKACLGTCLPNNWDEHAYGDLSKSELQYQSVASIKEEFPDAEIDETQPFCKENIEDCGEYCEEKCAEIHKKDLLPGGDLAERFKDDTKDFFSGILNTINPFSELGETMNMIISGSSSCCSCIILLLILFVAFKSSGEA